jgi:acetoacetyl-CoA synthetase
MPTLLWEPPAGMVERAVMTRFMRGRGIEGYDALWRWSVEDLEGFWASIWDFFGVEGGYDRVLASDRMPGAEWFPGARVNYAEHLFRGKADDAVAIVHASELRELSEITWGELRRQTAGMAARLRALGI